MASSCSGEPGSLSQKTIALRKNKRVRLTSLTPFDAQKPRACHEVTIRFRNARTVTPDFTAAEYSPVKFAAGSENQRKETGFLQAGAWHLLAAPVGLAVGSIPFPFPRPSQQDLPNPLSGVQARRVQPSPRSGCHPEGSSPTRCSALCTFDSLSRMRRPSEVLMYLSRAF